MSKASRPLCSPNTFTYALPRSKARQGDRRRSSGVEHDASLVACLKGTFCWTQALTCSDIFVPVRISWLTYLLTYWIMAAECCSAKLKVRLHVQSSSAVRQPVSCIPLDQEVCNSFMVTPAVLFVFLEFFWFLYYSGRKIFFYNLTI